MDFSDHVYVAKDKVIKVLNVCPEAEKEYKIGSILNHLHLPTIVKTYELQEQGKKCYLSLEFIDGNSLCNELYQSHITSLQDFFDIYLQILLTLEMAQREVSFTHFDLHCGNVMIRRLDHDIEYSFLFDTKMYTVKTNVIPVIIDFGFSCAMSTDKQYFSENHRTKTKEGYLLTKDGVHLENQGVMPFMIQGADMYRLISSCVYYTHLNLKEVIDRLYNKNHPYTKNIKLAIKEFACKIVNSKAASISPLEMFFTIYKEYGSSAKISITARQILVLPSQIEYLKSDLFSPCISKSFILNRYKEYIYKIQFSREKEDEEKEFDNLLLHTINDVTLLLLDDLKAIFEMTLPTINVKLIKKFKLRLRNIKLIDRYLLFSYMIKEASIECDFLPSINLSNYEKQITTIRSALRWCWTMEANHPFR